ncbi:MAG TPA: hypothetical protein VFT50_17770 [Baekduia sp.]|nr:hypothetical protein [Baekduia sp.]
MRTSHHAAGTSGVLTVTGLWLLGMIHVLDSVDTYHETRWLFWAYMALLGAIVVVSAGILRRPSTFWLRSAAALAGATMGGYVLSRTVGLPGADDEIGNWTDTLGLASLWVEGGVVLLATSAVALSATRSEAAVPATVSFRALEG